jgi:hypothetical protein
MSAWVVGGFSWLIISTSYWWDYGRGLSVGVGLELYLAVCVIKEHMELFNFQQNHNEYQDRLRIDR